MSSPDEPIGLNCPLCGTPATFTIGENQAFCGNDEDCRMLMWDPAQTRAEMDAEGAQEVELRPGGGS